MQMKAIQDYYPIEFAHCYGCGVANPDGHKLKSYLIGDTVEARFRVDPKYTGGFPDKVYGGLLASLLDCHGAASAAAFAHQAENKPLGEGASEIRFVTGTLKVMFHHPTPLEAELLLEGKLRSLTGRKATIDIS
jgi:acyl-coenzyme A thioesterase PaaI-like protein